MRVDKQFLLVDLQIDIEQLQCVQFHCHIHCHLSCFILFAIFIVLYCVILCLLFRQILSMCKHLWLHVGWLYNLHVRVNVFVNMLREIRVLLK
jgi:hypothetical protein